MLLLDVSVSICHHTNDLTIVNLPQGSRPTSVAGAVTFGILGYIGQGALHKSADKPEAERDRRTFWQKLADSRLSPIKSLSNEDYEKMLHDKLELVNAEIAIVDEKLSELSQAQQNTSKSIR